MNVTKQDENYESSEYDLLNEEIFSDFTVSPEPCLISKSINSCISQCC